jgi:hypothetical protein
LNAFDARFSKVELPASVAAGTTSVLPVEVRNMSPSPWLAEGPFRTGLTVSFEPEAGGNPSRAGSLRIGDKVESGDLLRTSVRVSWPEVPGRYRVWMDLTMPGLGSFLQKGSEPVAEGVVRVDAADRGTAP